MDALPILLLLIVLGALVGAFAYVQLQRRREAWLAESARIGRATQETADRLLRLPADPPVGQEAAWIGAREDLRRQFAALSAETAGLRERAPGDAQRARIDGLAESIGQVEDALARDQALRLASPPPTADQLRLSGATVTSRAQELRATAANFEPPPPHN